MTHFLLKEVPTEIRPRERLLQVGAQNLSDAEILAIVLRTGLRKENVLRFAERILHTFGSLHGLKEASLEELQEVHGLGQVKAIELKAVMELGSRLNNAKRNKLGQIVSSYHLGQNLISQMKDLQQEHLIGIYLNTKNEIIKQETLFIGSLNQSIAHPREIFKGAIKSSAANIILAHNHPSGNLTPSANDLTFTKRVAEIGELMGIPLLDHLIVGESDYLSLKEEGFIK
ncbi:RadC family protein [Enterococcus timonensis]|uniref:RadC family protein n=1 Tax=Enterococcus timonensis TaxID=1852364 RepID=UPI0008DA42C8|nr:DNA repair protein RadC [Enterococcus timonensis]